MDLRKMGIPFEKKYIELDQNTRDKVTQTYHNWQQVGYEESYHNEPEYCYSADKTEIEQKEYNLVPSKYIEFKDKGEEIDFDSKMMELQKDMREILKEQDEATKELKELFKNFGYAID